MKGKIIAIIFILLLIGSFGAAANNCGCDINKTINSDYSQKNQKYSLGLLVNPEDDPYLPEPITLSGDPPSSWDWRNIDGKDYTSPIRDQGNCGSCYAFGPISALETIYNIQNNDPDLDIDLSEQFLVSCSYGFPYMNKGCCGGTLGFTIAFLIIEGVPLESCFPYQAVDSKGRDGSDCPYGSPSNEPVKCSDRCSEWRNQVIKIETEGFQAIDDVNSIKIAVSTYGPVIAYLEVYEDFRDYSGGVYKYQTGEFLGGHCVSIVGYDDTQGCWICKNSWGAEWGENGFFKIAYGECKIEDLCCYFTSYIKSKSYSNPIINIILGKRERLSEGIAFPRFLEQFPILQKILLYLIK